MKDPNKDKPTNAVNQSTSAEAVKDSSLYKIEIRNQLYELADEDYCRFAASLIPNVSNMLGIRLPMLRKLAKTIAKSDWRSYMAEEPQYFEEAMLQAMVLGYAKAELDELLYYTAVFVPRINNWSVCDSLCIGLKFTIDHREAVWNFLMPYLDSDQEYEIRFAVVMMLTYYMDEMYMPLVFDKLDTIRHEGYYVKMAVAWALSYCYIHQPALTLAYFERHSLDDFTYQKALQKIVESNRVKPEEKEQIRAMKKMAAQREKEMKGAAKS